MTQSIITGRCLILFALPWVLLGTGCTMMRAAREAVAENQVEDVHPQRERRKAEVVRQFDQKRDEAQFSSAVTRWEQGDADTSEKLLQQLLQRNPEHLRAQLLLADVYLFRGELDRARTQLEQAALTNPDNAMVRHDLAQLLDALGRRDEALTHYQRAVELEPNNELYALSFHAINGAARRPNSVPGNPGVVLASANQAIETKAKSSLPSPRRQPANP